MDTIDMMGEVDVITQEQVEEQAKQERADRHIPPGTYEGLVMYHAKVNEEEKGEQTSFRGVPQYKVGVKMFDCPEVGRSMSQFFSMTPHKVTNPDTGRPRTAYTTLVGMVKALGMEGQPIPDVLEQAKVVRLKYRVGEFTGDDGEVRNYLKAVTRA